MSRRVFALAWGVKQSFRGYVEASGGQIRAEGDAQRSSDGEFFFPAAPGQDLTLRAEDGPAPPGAFLGQVFFEAHGGMLSVNLADPVLEIEGQAGRLILSNGDRRVAVAQLDLASARAGAEGELLIPAQLTAEGSQVLGDHYPPGTTLDPIRLKAD